MIHSAAGPRLRQACHDLIQAQGYPSPSVLSKSRLASSCRPSTSCTPSAHSCIRTSSRRRTSRRSSRHATRLALITWRSYPRLMTAGRLLPLPHLNWVVCFSVGYGSKDCCECRARPVRETSQDKYNGYPLRYLSRQGLGFVSGYLVQVASSSEVDINIMDSDYTYTRKHCINHPPSHPPSSKPAPGSAKRTPSSSPAARVSPPQQV